MERRQQSRIPTDGMQGRLGSGIPVRVTELSLQGIRLETRSALRPGGRYTLSLLDGVVSELETKVVWCRLVRCEVEADGETMAVYRAGLRSMERKK